MLPHLRSLCLLALLAPASAAKDWYVDATLGSDATGNGSAQKPWATISFALTQVPGLDDQIQVAPGRYDAALGEQFPLVLGPGQSLIGDGSNTTILDGDGSAPLLLQLAAGASSDVRVEGLALKRSLDGMHIAPSASGGQFLLRDVRCVSVVGTGFRVDASPGMDIAARLEDCASVSTGFGLRARFLNVNQSTLELERHTAQLCGVGVDLLSTAGSDSVFELRQLILRNCSQGVRVTSTVGSRHSLLIDGSLLVDSGTAVESVGEGDTTLRFSTVANNQQGLAGAQPPRYVLDHSIVWGNALVDLDPALVLSSTYTNSGVPLGGIGDRSVSPGFQDAAGGDYHLLPSSLLVDAGDLLHPPGGIDHDADPRACDGLITGVASVDIGWDEYNFAHLELIDPVVPGGAVRLETTAPAGSMYCMAAAVIVADFTVGSWGSLLLDFPSLIQTGCGSTPAQDLFLLSGSPVLAGLVFYFQSLTWDPISGAGSFTNRVSLEL